MLKMAVVGKAAGKGWQRVDIERLVTWALRDQGLGWSGRESSFADFAALGTLVDTSYSGSHPTIGLLDSDDAVLVKAAIDGLPIEARALLIRYGRTALRPDWGAEGEGAWEQEVDARGRKRWDWQDVANQTGARRPHMVFVGTDPEVIAAERAEYALWWQGLADIVAPLNARMSEHQATGPAVSGTPWLDVRPVVHGLEEMELPRKVRDEPAAQLRARAQDLVQGRATDWSAGEEMHREESDAAGRTHGRT
jgi:hypothetical protein